MGVRAPMGVTRAYYFAYPIGLFISFFTYWAVNWISPPPLAFPLSEWHEPKDYIRPEERGDMFVGRAPDAESLSVTGSAGEKGVTRGDVAVTTSHD